MTEKTRRYPCPGCAADLVFEPRDGSLSCPYCGRKEPIPASAEEVVERSYEEYLHVSPEQLQVLATDALEVQCEGCGATVTFTPPEVSARCPFCGRSRIGQPKSADPLVAPQGLLPFQITREQAQASVREWLGSRWFAPNALKTMARHENIGGIYLPFWTYDAHTTSHYAGQRGVYYYVAETYTETDAQGKSVSRTRQVRRTRWTPASGTVTRWHDDVLVPATRHLPTSRLDALAPWDLPALRPYDPAFLAGYRAQRYEVDLGGGFEVAKVEMDQAIRRDVAQDIGGDEQTIEQVATSFAGVTFKHLLLPVYLGAYRFEQKVYQVLVNARTGQVQGDRPYSVWKIAFFILGVLLVLVLLAILSDS